MKVEEVKVKEGMKGLWKEVFHDSEEYVKIVFDNYFNVCKSFYREVDGKVAAMLMAVPYDFASSAGRLLKGLYFCGVATTPMHRRKGLMAGLLEEANVWAREQGFDFTFLIPSDAANRLYYSARGYHDSFFKKEEYYVKDHKFVGAGNLTPEEFKSADRKELVEYLEATERVMSQEENVYTLLHSSDDWMAVIEESELSGGKIVLVRDAESNLSGVAFIAEEVTEDSDLVTVKKMFGKEETQRSLLKYIKEKYSEKGLKVVRDLFETGDNEGQLWQPFYAQSNSSRAEYEDIAEVEVPFTGVEGSYPMGMIRIVDMETFLNKTGLKGSDELRGFTDEELQGVVLRPAAHRPDELQKLLGLPELSFSISLLLE